MTTNGKNHLLMRQTSAVAPITALVVGGWLAMGYAQAQPATGATFSAKDFGVTQETIDSCASAYTVKSLTPLRGKMPMGFAEKPTAEMRANDKVPSPSERTAFAAYLAARDKCNAMASADTDRFLGKVPDASTRREPDDEFKQLQAGKLTYSEYFRISDRTSETRVAKAVKFMEQDTHSYQNFIEAWLAPSKAMYPQGSPWWDFYRYSIATAMDVDAGKLAQAEGQGLIEARRLKLNAELTGQPAESQATLNCNVSDGDKLRVERAILLDYGRKQVNGLPALFSDTGITWDSDATGGGKLHHNLNRLSGFISVGSTEYPVMFSGYCTPAKKQF